MFKRGFTLIELLAVVLIMGLLTAISLPQYRRSVERTRVAEITQLLPAIYDARDRLVTEWGFNSFVDITDPNTRKAVTFSRLDVEMKGQPESDTQNWKTSNARYTIKTDGFVGAVLTKGAYKGTGIYYFRGDFFCCQSAETSDACERLDVPIPSSKENCNTLKGVLE